MRSELLSLSHYSGGECPMPLIRSYVDFQAWARGGCVVDPQNDLPRFKFYTVGQFLEWAYHHGWNDRSIERILANVGTVRGRSGGGEQDQGALNAQIFTAASTGFTVPDNTNWMAWNGFGGGGGGGGGGDSASQSSGGAGGGGSMQSAQITATTPGGSLTVIAGAGGTSGTAGNASDGGNGGPGTDSSVNTAVPATFGGASGGGAGSIQATFGSFGGMAIKAGAANLYSAVTFSTTAQLPPPNGAHATYSFLLSVAGGGCTQVSLAGGPGLKNNSGGFAGGTGGGLATVSGGGGGGGAGILAAGGNGGAGVTSGAPNAGASPAANTGAGAGGGGGQAAAATAAGAGGVGGSGQVTGVW